MLIFDMNIKTNKIMYSLNCTYFTQEFSTRQELISHCTSTGMDPNYEITKDGRGTGEELIDFLVF
jgi:hypothetical protein